MFSEKMDFRQSIDFDTFMECNSIAASTEEILWSDDETIIAEQEVVWNEGRWAFIPQNGTVSLKLQIPRCFHIYLFSEDTSGTVISASLNFYSAIVDITPTCLLVMLAFRDM